MAPPAIPGLPKNRQLSAKESTLFKQLLQLHDTKQYKKAIKTADTILKKHPDHGETLAMKGLILVSTDKKEEGLELVKKGVRNDLTSHIVWHVYGIVHRFDRNFDEALKCYSQALKHDPDNVALLRDVCGLATQLRQWGPLVESRAYLVRTRPSMRQHWVALAVALDLAGLTEKAAEVLAEWEGTLKSIGPKVTAFDYELSEIYLYHASLLEKSGKLFEALAYLDECESEILDVPSWREARARVLTALGRTDEAADAWRLLIQANPENKAYYFGFLRNRGIDVSSDLTEKSSADALQVVTLFGKQFPKSSALQLLQLAYAHGDRFRELADAYLTARLSKGVPSLFADIKDLYADEAKRQTVQDLVEGYREELSSSGAFHSSDDRVQPTTSYLWTLYFLTQHYSQLGSFPRALELIEAAIAHTPTLPELYTAKARALKRAGDAPAAAAALEEARALDGQDRFLNSKSAKYLIRAGKIAEAEEVLGLFTRKAALSPAFDLIDMQCLWFIREEARAYGRAGDLGMALKRIHQLVKIIEEWEDDQYDFHTYCLRKYTLRAYIETLQFEDEVRSHPAYVQSALEAVEIYTRLFDNPGLVKSLTGESNGLSAEEKKAAKKAKKAQLKAAEGAGKSGAPAAAAPPKDEDGLPVPPQDTDPRGHALLKASDPLAEAEKILRPLETLAQNKVETWSAVFEVAFRRKKYLHALRALRRAHALDANAPSLHLQLLRFRKFLDSNPELPSTIAPVIRSEFEAVFPAEVSTEAYNSDYLQRRIDDSAAVLAAARGILEVRGADAGKEHAADLVFQLVREETKVDRQTAEAAQTILRELESSRVDEFRAAAAKRFPLSAAFKTPEQREKEREQREAQTKAEDGKGKEETVGGAE